MVRYEAGERVPQVVEPHALGTGSIGRWLEVHPVEPVVVERYGAVAKHVVVRPQVVRRDVVSQHPGYRWRDGHGAAALEGLRGVGQQFAAEEDHRLLDLDPRPRDVDVADSDPGNLAGSEHPQRWCCATERCLWTAAGGRALPRMDAPRCGRLA